MSGIGRVPTSPSTVTTDTDTTPATTTTTTTPTTSTTTTSRTSTTTRPTPPAAPPKASDIVPASILTKYGLDPNKLTTENKYTGDRWNVGYYPYDGDIQYVAFGKYQQLFKNDAAGADAHSYWEGFSNPPSNIEPGSWIGSGTISEDDFEKSTGVDISGDRPIDNAAYKLMREAGAPMSADFAMRDKDGKQLALKAGDRLVPTVVEGGKLVEVEVRDEGEYFKKGTNDRVSGDVTWRLKGSDGAIRGATTDKKEDRFALAGASDNVKFDFLDAAGEILPYNPPSDKIVNTWKDGSSWNALVPKKDAQGKITGYEHQKLDADGKRVTSRADVTPDRAKELTRGKDTMYRIQSSSGQLQGDGKVGNSYDQSWWGKCHNVAAIGASSIKLPQQEVKVVSNLARGDRLATQWKEGANTMVLLPKRSSSGSISSYTLQTRDASGRVTSTAQKTNDEANRLATEKKSTPVIVTSNGKLKQAELTTVGKEEVTAMVAHMGDGAVEYKGSVGSRFYGYPDQLRMKDGSTKGAFITGVKLNSGKTVDVGSKSGTADYDENDRSVLRGPGLDSKRINSGGRNVGWSSQDFQKLQDSKTDKIKELTIQYPDGRTETVPADKVASLGWENKFDLSPTELWSMHGKVGEKGSSVIEKDPGTHVWNYTMEDIATTPLKKEQLPSWLKDKASMPGMLKGTTGDEGKHFFSTKVNGQEYTYWAKFDGQGNMTDYAYMSDSTPDFFWTQHTKDPFSTTWTGEAQAPGARMEDIQKVYLASIGGFKKFEVAGGVLSLSDLNRKATRP